VGIHPWKYIFSNVSNVSNAKNRTDSVICSVFGTNFQGRNCLKRGPGCKRGFPNKSSKCIRSIRILLFHLIYRVTPQKRDSFTSTKSRNSTARFFWFSKRSKILILDRVTLLWSCKWVHFLGVARYKHKRRLQWH